MDHRRDRGRWKRHEQVRGSARAHARGGEGGRRGGRSGREEESKGGQGGSGQGEVEGEPTTNKVKVKLHELKKARATLSWATLYESGRGVTHRDGGK
jgi:hypothetical protein